MLIRDLIDSANWKPLEENVIPDGMNDILGEFCDMQKNQIFQKRFKSGLQGKKDLSWNELLKIYNISQESYAETKAHLFRGGSQTQ